MSKDPKILFEHILESIEWIEKDINSMEEDEFFKNVPIQDAVIRRFEIIGEAVRNLPQEIKNENPQAPWLNIADMGNKLIHEYFEVDLELVWEVIKKDLPSFKKQIKGLLEN